MRLSQAGYGTIAELLKLDIKRFLNLIHYEVFQDKYNKAVRALNKKDNA